MPYSGDATHDMEDSEVPVRGSIARLSIAACVLGKEGHYVCSNHAKNLAH
jgi:hypothetical protein